MAEHDEHATAKPAMADWISKCHAMKTELISQPIRPFDCKTIADVCSLQKSCKDIGEFWIMIQHNGAIILAKQYKAHSVEDSIVIPRHVFQQFVRWYETEQ